MSEVPAFSTLNLILSDNILDVQLNRPESAKCDERRDVGGNPASI